MRTAALLIVLLSQDGYWFGDRAGEIRFEATAQAPAGRVTWDLMYGPVRVGGGATDVAPGRAAAVRVSPPPVRARTTLRLTYRFTDAAGKELDAGEAALEVFPDDVLDDAARILNGKRLVVWGTSADPLDAFLTSARVPHTVAAGVRLSLSRPDVILFGPAALDSLDTLVRPSLEALARPGASVIVFRQERSARVDGYRLARRTAPKNLAWRGDHPLLASFNQHDLESLAPARSTQLALRLPADEPALELAFWPAEVGSHAPGPVDALLVTKTVGRGRVVTCQLPFRGDWSDDVRGQMFLRAALEYAVTPAGPTPRPSERVGGDDIGRKAGPSRPSGDERDILVPRGK